MAGEVRAIGGALREIVALRGRRLVGAHVRRDPILRLYTRAGIADPYPVYAWVRAQGPMLRLRRGDRATAHYDCCREVLRSRDFGVRMPGDPGPSGPGPDVQLDLGMLERDPPDHTRLRRLVAPAFTPAAIARHRALVEATADQLLDRAVRAGRFDLVTDYAAPLPVTIITALLGLDGSDAAVLAGHGAAISSALDGVRSPAHLLAVIRAAGAIEPAFARLIEARRREPRDDLVSALVAASDGGRLTAYELYVTCSLLLVAGFETTVNLIGNAVSALLDRPELWAALRDDPGLAGAVAEEVLRYDPPVQATYRVAQVPTEVAGERFRPGEGVALFLGGAARDPAAYPDPDRVQLHRPRATDHLAFSAGPHYCAGAPLARLEAEVALRRLVERMPRLTRAGRGRWRPATTIRGYASLPVRA
ncbi:MAG TPA: cytochrome P450 [Mycobacteriales bacterium]|nr:cytochrome P450 [Mycobacteriales bacterium]